MAYGKTIEMFLVDGIAEGVVTAELSNWNGKAIKIPRTEIIGCSREDIKGVGVYFLFCKEDDGGDSVYIGEAENVQKRLEQHLRDYKSGKERYFWNTAVAFVGRDLNKALIRYLEDRLVGIARECGRKTILTKRTYTTTLKESQVASMEEFIANTRVLLSALNYRVLTPIPEADDDTVFLFCKGSGADGKGFVSASGFTVVKGSRISDHIVESMQTRSKGYLDLREQMISEGVIVDDLFMRDYEFSAPSAASTVILGRPSSGNADWKDATGASLRDVSL